LENIELIFSRTRSAKEALISFPVKSDYVLALE